MTAKTNEFGGNLTWFLDEAIAQVDKSQSIDVITTNEDGSEGIIKLSLQDILVAAIDEINSKKRS
ncbi:MAG: hypothetical protein GY774_20625 [Planctomycetes bacterium]|nr:hypothetical protein [Planctomycetota bacterium]